MRPSALTPRGGIRVRTMVTSGRGFCTGNQNVVRNPSCSILGENATFASCSGLP